MKKFVLKMLLSCALIIAVGIGIVTYVGNYYWHKRVPIIKKEKAEHAPGPVSLVLGSSHTFYGINSALIADNCYNMAAISQTLYEDYLVLREVSAKRKVEFVILPLSFFSNGSSLYNATFDGEYMRIFDYEHAYGAHYPHTPRYAKSRFVLYTELAKGMLAHSMKKNSFEMHGNHTEHCTSTTFDISDSIKAFDRHLALASFTTRNPYLDSIIHVCTRRNIKLNIVVMPFTQGYNRQIAAKGAAFEPFLASLKSLQLNNYKFLDCRNFITSNEPIFFRDADHLSPCGCDTFSRYLSRNILR